MWLLGDGTIGNSLPFAFNSEMFGVLQVDETEDGEYAFSVYAKTIDPATNRFYGIYQKKCPSRRFAKKLLFKVAMALKSADYFVINDTLYKKIEEEIKEEEATE